MQNFKDSVKAYLLNKNWFGALFLALALPDICATLEDPDPKINEIGKRYRAWFNKYLKELYDPTSVYTFMKARKPDSLDSMGDIAEILKSQPIPQRVRFTADDCYKARCKCLHQGSVEMNSGETFIFITPPPGEKVVHGNLCNGMYQLQIDTFCEDICEAVTRWEGDISLEDDVQTRIAELLTIHPYDSLDGISFGT
jgi:hypothetical protein